MGFASEVGAFDFFRAVAQNADARVLRAEDLLAVKRTHDGELGQINRLALGRGAPVDEDKVASLRRHNGCDSGALDALEGTQSNGGRGNHSAGVSGGNKRLTTTIFQKIN